MDRWLNPCRFRDVPKSIFAVRAKLTLDVDQRRRIPRRSRGISTFKILLTLDYPSQGNLDFMRLDSQIPKRTIITIVRTFYRYALSIFGIYSYDRDGLLSWDFVGLEGCDPRSNCESVKCATSSSLQYCKCAAIADRYEASNSPS